MENGSKKCFGCVYFNRYYTRGLRKFHDTKFGWCGEKKGTVVNTDSCKEFILKRRRQRYKESVRITLNNLLTEITAIRKIIEEDMSDDKEV